MNEAIVIQFIENNQLVPMITSVHEIQTFVEMEIAFPRVEINNVESMLNAFHLITEQPVHVHLNTMEILMWNVDIEQLFQFMNAYKMMIVQMIEFVITTSVLILAKN